MRFERSGGAKKRRKKKYAPRTKTIRREASKVSSADRPGRAWNPTKFIAAAFVIAGTCYDALPIFAVTERVAPALIWGTFFISRAINTALRLPGYTTRVFTAILGSHSRWLKRLPQPHFQFSWEYFARA